MVEGAGSSVIDFVGEPSDAAKEAFAAFVDNLRDYNDIRDAYGETQRIELDRFLDGFLETIGDEDAAIAVGTRANESRVQKRSA